MYLAIYQSVDSNVDFQLGDTQSVIATTTAPVFAPVASLAAETSTALVSWAGHLLSPSLLIGR
jgi:hypothetical protein